MNIVIKRIARILSMLILLYAAGCRVVLVPEYNQDLDKQIINTEKLNDQLYLELLALPQDQRTYDSCKKKYLEIELQINSIMFQNKSRKQNTDMIAILQTLKKKFLEYEEEHKKGKVLSDGMLQAYEADIMAAWQPLLTAEQALKKIKP